MGALTNYFSRLFQSDSLLSESQLLAASAVIKTRRAANKTIVGIEFFNKQATNLNLWIELACIEVELKPGMEYRIESDETEYRIEFDEQQITLYLQYRFGPKVYKRPYSSDFKKPAPWYLLHDYSDIEYRLP